MPGREPTLLYALHWSEWTCVPGATWAAIIGSKVAASRLETICMKPKAGVLEESAMPNTHVSFAGALPL